MLIENLTEKEKELIEKFNHSQKQRISRILPLPTASFQNLTVNYQSVLSIPSEVIKALKEKENCDILDEDELIKLIFDSINEGDIPFFTKKGDLIYHETTSICIAKIRRI